MQRRRTGASVRRFLPITLSGAGFFIFVVSLLCVSSNQALAALLLPDDAVKQLASPVGLSSSNRGAIRHNDTWYAESQAVSLLQKTFTEDPLSTDGILSSVFQAHGPATKRLARNHSRFTIDLSQYFSGQGSLSNEPEAFGFQERGSVKPLPSMPSPIFLFGPGVIVIFGVLLRQESVLKQYKATGNSQGDHGLSPHSTLILLLSPETTFAKDIADQLYSSGYQTRVVPSIAELFKIAQQVRLSLVLVDQRVSDWDMLRTDTKLRHVPMMTLVPVGATYTDDDSLADLERGADGVHLCQDGGRLLVAKVGAYLRRAGYEQSRRGVCRVGAVELDADSHEVKVGGRRFQLSAKPYAILEVLMKAPSKLFSRSELIKLVWGADFAIGHHTLDVHVHAIRQQLNRDPEHLCRLISIKGVGFKLKSFPPAITAASVQDALPMAVNSLPLLRSRVACASSITGSTTQSPPSHRRTMNSRLPRQAHPRPLRSKLLIRQLQSAV